VRPESGDLFGYGAREAVVRALAGAAEDRVGFGAAATADELAGLVRRVLGDAAPVVVGDDLVEVAAADPRLEPLAFACGWEVEPGTGVRSRIRPSVP
jgi:coenzyme F420-0:L-glutamate ligase / coenzyme F420-1:gamma-L-glutamate ligase